MPDLSDEQAKRLLEVVTRRLGARSDPKTLVEAYLTAAVKHAYARTCEMGSVPTSIVVERSTLLIEISRELGRVIEDFEIQCLYRVTLTQAKSMRTTLLATYLDDTDELTLAWSLVDATRQGRRDVGKLNGKVIVFTSEERRDAFFEQAQRLGASVAVVHGDPATPFQVVVGDDFPTAKLPPE